MDSYGITPKGQQDRRWIRPVVKPPSMLDRLRAGRDRGGTGPYDHLRVTQDPASAKQRLRALQAGTDGESLVARFERLNNADGSYRDPRLDPVE